MQGQGPEQSASPEATVLLVRLAVPLKSHRLQDPSVQALGPVLEPVLEPVAQALEPDVLARVQAVPAQSAQEPVPALRVSPMAHRHLVAAGLVAAQPMPPVAGPPDG